MSTARPKLAAASRTLTGKKVAHMRRDGRLPAVVFGRGLASDNVSVDAHEFEQLRRHTGPNTLIDLSVDGGAAAPVLVSGVQIGVVNRRPLHVDLFLVRMTEELTVDVPLVSEGTSDAIENGSDRIETDSSATARVEPAETLINVGLMLGAADAGATTPPRMTVRPRIGSARLRRRGMPRPS